MKKIREYVSEANNNQTGTYLTLRTLTPNVSPIETKCFSV